MIKNFWALFKNYNSSPLLYHDSRSAIYVSLQALSYCLRGGYTPDQFESGGYVSFRQLEREKINLFKTDLNFQFSRIESLFFPFSKRLSLLCFVVIISFFSVFSARASYSLLSLVMYIRLTHDRREKIFTYFGFLEEVKNCLWLCQRNTESIDYYELANFYDDSMVLAARRLIVTYDLGANYLEKSEKVTVDRIVYQRPSSSILLRAENVSHNSKKVAFFASGYYSRQRHQTHDRDFLSTAERLEASVITSLARASEVEGWHLVICPHYARNVENYNEALEYYATLLGSNFDIDAMLSTTSRSPYEFNLSTTFGSNVFFDAFGQGLKAVIVEGPDVFQQFLNSSKMKEFSVSKDMIEAKWVESVLAESNYSFLAKRLGGKENDSPKS